MAPKRAVRKQQDSSRTPAKKAAAEATSDPLAQFGFLADNFDAAATQCVQDAELDAVHRVRTGSRRLQATLEAMLREAPEDVVSQVAPAAQSMLRPLRQIRRAAGPVRDLDVHRKLLEKWLAEPSLTSEANVLRTQAETLDTWLKAERKQRSHGMQKQIRKRLQELPERRSSLASAIQQMQLGTRRAMRSADAVALQDFVCAADAMPLLDAGNLHEFRKATKKARYVAEAGDPGPSSSSVAKALKRIQDSIGEWHDWLCLANEAKTALDADAPQLSAALSREVELHFTAALETILSMRGRLIGEWVAMNQPQRRQPTAAVATRSGLAVSGF